MTDERSRAPEGAPLAMLAPITIKGVSFKNRVLRSAMGGKLAFYDGTPTVAWKNFEMRFAAHGVGGIVSTTMTVDDERWAPLEYPKFTKDTEIPVFAAAIREIQRAGCRYLVQIGDPGYHTQASLFPQAADSKTSSGVFDLLYGYRNTGTVMSHEDIARSVRHHAEGVRRAQRTGCDGVEITASKGYLIHQFLNPGVNRREDEYGGSVEKRFRFLREIVVAARALVGPDFLIGIKLSAIDYNYLPINVRLPLRWRLRHSVMGNGLPETTRYAKWLEELGIDYVHVTRGFGFINPKENPGDWPLEQIRMFCNATRHLSAKATLRATLLNTLPDAVLRLVMGHGWKQDPGGVAELAGAFKREVGIPIIANGGFQDRDLIERTLTSGQADLVSMARPLLANPDLLQRFARGEPVERPCTFCNRCVVLTAVQPVGCYEPKRFASQKEMETQILHWAGDHAAVFHDEPLGAPLG